jgi:N-acetyl-anhydromuramyl-L-alanine amidase AmpD
MNIKQYPFKDTQYIKQKTEKNQIYLHHTAGSESAEAVYKWWEMNRERIATHFVIGGNGDILQGFKLDHWAYHLGAKESTFNSLKIRYRSLDKQSVGIELCNWGQLTYKDGTYYNYVGRPIDRLQVTELEKPHKGIELWHSYTDAQIESLGKLLIYLEKEIGVKTIYRPFELWDIAPSAFMGVKGTFTHNSVRRDKVDVYPCPKLIRMLQEL